MLPACIRYWHSKCNIQQVQHPTASSVMVWASTWYTTCTSLVQINSNLKADQNIFDILSPVDMFYLRDLPNTTFQQDIARPNVVF